MKAKSWDEIAATMFSSAGRGKLRYDFNEVRIQSRILISQMMKERQRSTPDGQSPSAIPRGCRRVTAADGGGPAPVKAR